tara:strand:+ start:234 stop:473 length:240 start_codon:yes stop_codon:yes gene_type:complete
MSNKLYTIVAKVFDIEISEINDKSSPETIDSWDSMNMYVLIDEIENLFHIKFSLDEILEINTVNDLKNLLIKHGCNMND